MAYTQTIVLKKTGSDWDFISEAVAELQADINDAEYIGKITTNEALEELFSLDDLDQILTLKRIWQSESDAAENLASSDILSKLSAAGWTITES